MSDASPSERRLTKPTEFDAGHAAPAPAEKSWLERMIDVSRDAVDDMRALAGGGGSTKRIEEEIGAFAAQARKLSASMQNYGTELRAYGAWAKKS